MSCMKCQPELGCKTNCVVTLVRENSSLEVCLVVLKDITEEITEMESEI